MLNRLSQPNDALTFTSALQDLANDVQAKLDRGLTSRVLQSNHDIVEVKNLVEKVMSLIDVFEVCQSEALFLAHMMCSLKVVSVSR